MIEAQMTGQLMDAALSQTPLDADIQTAWSEAKATLPCVNPDPRAVSDLIESLQDCAERAKAIGFENGERELLRMAKFLRGRITPSDFPRYGTDR
jgi:hypothetical protein